MWLIAGLGNPGRRYAGTRHNAGYMVVDALLDCLQARPARARLGAEVAETTVAGTKVIFCKPMEFMNMSGLAVARAAGFWKISPSQILVVHDEMDLELGRLKVGQGGGTAGHNGLHSIVAELGTEAFCRLRFGIGRPPARWEGADFVLADFAAEERKILPNLIEGAAEVVTTVVRDGLVAAMNKFNRRSKSKEGAA
jgi:PTH1 family peptidyl-tRNA hydrolase